MRITVDEALRAGLIGRIDVFLDGQRVRRCIEADEEAGYVLCHKEDENGNLVIGPDGFPVVECREGNVAIAIEGTLFRAKEFVLLRAAWLDLVKVLRREFIEEHGWKYVAVVYAGLAIAALASWLGVR